LHLGLYEELPLTLKDVLLRKAPVMHAIFLHPATGLRLLPAPLKGNINLKGMDKIIKELKATYEPILVDCAPGLGRDVMIAMKSIDKAILVTTPDLPAVTDVLKTINLLEKLKKGIIGIVLNRVKEENYELTREEIESTCGYDIISVIPETDKIPQSVAEGVPLVMNSNSQTAVEFRRLAASLIGAEYQPEGLWHRLKHFFSMPKISKAKFVRDIDGMKKEKLIKERALEEEQAAVDGLEEDLREELKAKKKLKGPKAKTKTAYTADLEKELMRRVKEKLRERSKR